MIPDEAPLQKGDSDPGKIWPHFPSKADVKAAARLDALEEWQKNRKGQGEDHAFGAILNLLYTFVWLPVCVIGLLAACYAFPILIPILIIGWIIKANRRSTAAAVQRAVREELARRDAANGPL